MKLVKPKVFASITCLPSKQVSPKSPLKSIVSLFHVDAHMIKTGFDIQTYHSNHLLQALLDQGQLLKARKLFDEMPMKNTFTANRMISGYAKSGYLEEARRLFNCTADRTAVTWTILINAFSQAARPEEAFDLFRCMWRSGISPDHVAIVALLSSFCSPDTSSCVIQVHAHIVKSGLGNTTMVFNTMVDSYCKCGSAQLGRKLFNEARERDSVTFNAMLMGHSKDGSYSETLELFVTMRNLGLKPSQFTFSGVLATAAGLSNLELGQQIHGLIVKTNFSRNVFVCNSLLDFYSKCCCLTEARALFDGMEERDNVSYNVMVSCYAWDGQIELIRLFKEMQYLGFDRSQFPFPTLISVAGGLPDLVMGRQIHAQVILTGLACDNIVCNALVDMYSKCGHLKTAVLIFRNGIDKDTVSCTAMISGYVENGLFEEAVRLFCEMRRDGMIPDRATFSIILRATSSLALLSLGKQLHSNIIKCGYMSDVFAGSAILDMYAKCGCFVLTQKIFNDMPNKNTVSWNAMLCAHAQNGQGRKAIDLFEEMLRQDVKPDFVTFLCVLSACSHNGLVKEGLQYFDSMSKLYELKPKREHYACVIDLMGRVGRLDEVEKLVNRIPFEADQIIWNSILNSSRIHGNQELARHAADRLFSMDIKDSAPFVIMSNVYAQAGQWDAAAKVKKMMRDQGLKKEPAYSWVEIMHKIFVFSSNDNMNPQINEIKDLLDKLRRWKRKVIDLILAFHFIWWMKRIESLRYHSERLVISFSILNRNTYSCNEKHTSMPNCQAATKVIAKIVEKEIRIQ